MHHLLRPLETALELRFWDTTLLLTANTLGEITALAIGIS